jgi:hypothetical protein
MERNRERHRAMSRKRVIDTELYFDTELHKLLGCEGLHLYIRLWGLADDSGVYEPRYEDIALQMGALRLSAEKVRKHVDALIRAGKIIPYAANGREYHWLKNFQKHQPLSTPSLPRYPLPEWIEYDQREYPSGKKFATYRIIPEKLPEITGSLPVGYQDTTGNGEGIGDLLSPGPCLSLLSSKAVILICQSIPQCLMSLRIKVFHLFFECLHIHSVFAL